MAEEILDELRAKPFSGERDYIDNLIKLEIVRMQLYMYEETNLITERELSQNKYLPDVSDINYILDKKGNDRKFQGNLESIISWEEYIEERRSLSNAGGLYFLLDEYMYLLGLTLLGRSVIIQSLMAGVDSEYQEVFKYLNGDVEKPYPTIALSSKLFCFQETPNSASYYQISSREFEGLSVLFPQMKSSEMPFQQALSPDSTFIAILLGTLYELPDYMHRFSPFIKDGAERAEELRHLLFRDELISHVSDLISDAIDSVNGRDEVYPDSQISGANGKPKMSEIDRDVIVILRGEKGSGKKSIIERAALERKCGVTYFDVYEYRDVPEISEEKLYYKLRLSMRDALLRDELFAIEGLNCIDDRITRLVFAKVHREILKRLHVVFILIDDPMYTVPEKSVVTIDIEPFDDYQRSEIWKQASSSYSIDDANREELLTAVSNTFTFTPGQIKDALSLASRAAAGGKMSVSAENLFHSCYMQTDHELQKKAQRVRSGFTWEDIKLPDEDKQVLREISYRVKEKHTVMSKWNFAQKLPYGSGTPVVFAGPPGTGKTMAAQVLANELHMEMYRIDLSQLVDKYIGETEKNIKMVFEQARKSSSILFFDEADAIFGKRIEANTSNDRYANIESSLLLQCVEDYNGISILATNNMGAMDTAFVRRFKYVLFFRIPDVRLRREIWESVFPSEAPISDDVDLEWLAENFSFTGAAIKNIALSAAFLAAGERSDINSLHLLKGIKKELIKEGRELTVSDLGEYGYLFGDV